jgi:hypothetical protein
LLVFVAAQGQTLQEESLVVNVEVHVRVFRGNTFVDTLKAGDFVLTENGVPQKIEAVYFIRNREIERREEGKKFRPDTGRNFYLFFEVTEYVPKLDEALRYFVNEVLVPGDNIVLVTPMKTYRMLGEAIAAKRREDILNQIQGLLRRDTGVGISEYREIIQEMERLAKALSQQIAASPSATTSDALTGMDAWTTPENDGRPIEDLLQRYSDLLDRLELVRSFDPQKLIDLSVYLKGVEGQKWVFLFYQREFMPKIESRILHQYIELYQDRPNIQHTISRIFDFYRRELTFDPKLIQRAFADAAVSSHFLFISSPPETVPGIQLEEQSDDVYSAFREISHASGGFLESSANPAELMRKAVEVSESYYLLYYSPQKYVRDGKFKEIKVRLKAPGLRAVYRLGYFAR